MKALVGLFFKEWAQHRWILFVQFGFLFLSFAFALSYMEGAQYLSRGSFSFAFLCWGGFAFVIASSLSHRLFTLDLRSQTENFIAGLPVYRWQTLMTKVLFAYIGLSLVCFAFYTGSALISPHAQLNSWQAIVFPLVRLSVFNLVMVTVVFLVGMLGKFRWVVYLLLSALIVTSENQLLAFVWALPPFRLIDEEKALGELSALPWKLIVQNLWIALAASILIPVVDLLIRWRFRELVSGLPRLTDRVAVLAGLGLVVVLISTKVDEYIPSEFDLRYHLAFDVDGESRSGSTLVQFSYYKTRPKDDAELESDKQMVSQVSRALESVRTELNPPWWPERWVLVKSPDVSRDKSTWARRISGEALVSVANWGSDTKADRKKVAGELALHNLTYFLDATVISDSHLNRHGWVTSGIGVLLLSRMENAKLNRFFSSNEKDLELLESDKLEQWVEIIAKTERRRNLSCILLNEVEQQLGEEEFRAWIRETAGWCFTKPRANTPFSFKRGPIYWRGLLRSSVIAMERRGLDRETLISNIRNQQKKPS